MRPSPRVLARRVMIALALFAALLGGTSARADKLCIDVTIPDSELRDFPYCIQLP